jgi:predicted type IV restriction endonuclease
MPKKLTEEDKYFREFSEAQWQALVIRIAMYAGWKHYHPPDNRPNKNGKVQQNIVAGFPDLVLVKNERLIFAELKKETGILSAAQKDWLSRLEKTGAEVYVWRPSQQEEVEKILEGE